MLLSEVVRSQMLSRYRVTLTYIVVTGEKWSWKRVIIAMEKKKMFFVLKKRIQQIIDHKY